MALTNKNYKGGSLSLTINSVEYNMDLKNLAMDNEDKDVVTFADVATGALQWFLKGTAVWDAATGSLWRYIWDNALTENVAFSYKPFGNTPATPTKPWFTGTLTVPAKVGFSVEAGEVPDFEARFDINGTPAIVTS